MNKNRPRRFKIKALTLALATSFAGVVVANPQAPSVVAGQAAIQQSGKTLSITNTPGAIINWQSFNIDRGELTRFIQQNAQSSVLNRVTGVDPSKILGNLQSNGRVLLVNPNGVLFGKDARVDVAGLLVSTLQIKDADFLAGKYKFNDTPGAGKIENQGSIQTASGGQVILIAPQIENSGLIHAPEGHILLAAGKSVTLADPDKPAIQVEITNSEQKAVNLGTLIAKEISIYGGLIKNTGLIHATTAQVGANGKISLRAKYEVENTGTIQANGPLGGDIVIQAEQGTAKIQGTVEARALTPEQFSVQQQATQQIIKQASAEPVVTVNPVNEPKITPEITAADYSVLLTAEPTALGAVSTTLAANWLPNSAPAVQVTVPTGPLAPLNPNPTNPNNPLLPNRQQGQGGSVRVLGRTVRIEDGAMLSATGTNGGGEILIGGDYQGKNVEIQNAQTTFVAATARLDASALESGNGGKIIVWADGNTEVHGSLAARGGASSGDGGFIETSGHFVDLQGIRVNAGSAYGKNGQWLLDPSEITIDHGGAGNAGANFSPSGTTTIHDSDINAALDAQTDVLVQATWNGANVGSGSIVLLSAVSILNSTGGNRNFTLKADGSITLNAGASIAGSDGNPLNVTLHANARDSIGAITLNASSQINSFGGNVLLSGGIDPTTGFARGISTDAAGIAIIGSTISTGGGNLTLRGKGFATGFYSYGIQVYDDSLLSADAGNISLVGWGGGADSVSNRGIVVGSVGGTASAHIMTTSGSITLEGHGAWDGDGIVLQSDAIINSASGSILLEGTSGNGGVSDSERGIRVSSAYLDTAGNITLRGISHGQEDTNSHGVLIEGGNISAGGNLLIEGATLDGATAANSNYGVYIANGVTLDAQGTLTLSSSRDVFIGASLAPSGDVLIRADNLGTGIGTVIFDGSGWLTVANGKTANIYYNPVSYNDSATKSGAGWGDPYQNEGYVQGDLSNYKAWMLVSTVNQLQAMETNLSGYYALGRNIDATDTANWNSGAGFNPIGLTGDFMGGLDGLGHVIDGLTINRAQNNVGLFKSVGPVSIQNLGLTNVDLTGLNYVGALAGKFYGFANQVYSTGTVRGSVVVGGLLGYTGGWNNAQSVVRYSWSSANVTATGSLVGGLVGSMEGPTLISNSYATGNVSGVNSVGGLVGESVSREENLIQNSYATGNVSGTRSIGGLVGLLDYGTIDGSYSKGTVTASNQSVGGLLGENYGNVSNSYSESSVIGGNSAGGLVGYNGSVGTVTKSYSIGSVSGGTDVGGLIGRNTNSTGVTLSYWNAATSGMAASAGGTGLTSAQMLIESNFAGFDFDTTWTMHPVSGLPVQQTFQPVTLVTNTWTGAVNNFWLTSGNWSLDHTPTATEVVVIPDILSRDFIELATGVVSVKRLTSSEAFRLGSGSALTVSGATTFNNTLTLANSALLTVNGALSLNSPVSLGQGSRIDLGASATLAIGNEGITLIRTAAELQNMSHGGGAYALANNIDASSIANFVPRGNYFYNSGRFGGLFDGLGHTIDRLTINYPTGDAVGLFGGASNATIRNVGLTNVSITGQNYVGGLVGHSESVDISNVYVTGRVSGLSSVGGVVGELNGDLTNAYSTASVIGRGGVGGLVGSGRNGNISNAYATGVVSGLYGVGGLVGNALYGSISNVYATGAVTGSDEIGGLVGSISNGSIAQAYATGAVSGLSNVGGLIGFVNCDYGCGSTRISNTYATGSVTGTEQVGGLVGELDSGLIEKSYASGAVTGSRRVGGLVGDNSGSIENSYWDKVTSTQGEQGIGLNQGNLTNVVGLSASEAMQQSTFAGFDFATDWWLSETNTRPFLRSEWSNSITNAHQLQLMAMQPDQAYTLARDIDLAPALNQAGSMWSAKGFAPIGNAANPFTGSLDGQGFVLANLSINRPTENAVGLFGVLDATGSVSKFGLLGGVVIGGSQVGALAGVSAGIISNAYSTINVSGSTDVGGLLGSNSGTLRYVYSLGAMDGTGNVGGLAGSNTGLIDQAYAAGAVSGSSNQGGLVGDNTGGTLSASFWDTSTTGQANAVGGGSGSGAFGSNTSELSSQSTYIAVGWDFSTAGNWWMSDSNTRPFLRSEWQNSIGNAHQLQLMAMRPEASYTLNQDINLAPALSQTGGMWNSKGFVPIGDEGTPFTGKLDGQGFEIANLTINRPDELNVGLFGSTATGSLISRVGLVGGSVTGNGNVGSLVGYSNGNVSDVYSSAAVDGLNTVGGLVGYNIGDLSMAYSTGSVSSTLTGQKWSVGGLVGVNDGSISHAYSSSTVYATNATNVGGLVGANYGSIDISYATAAVTGNDSVGGLAGYSEGGIYETFASGAISGSSRVGGLVGLRGWGGTIGASFWDIDSSSRAAGIAHDLHQESTPGLYGLTAANRFSYSAYSGWSLGNNGDWWMADGYTRPFLRSEWSNTITNAHQLQLVAMRPDQHYLQTRNIDFGTALNQPGGMWSSAGFEPINSDGFSGSFDGLGHQIDGLRINRTASTKVGLFGELGSTGWINNVHLTNVAVSTVGDAVAGGLVGYNNGGTISHSSVSGSVQGLGVAGGLVGYNYGGTISNSSFRGGYVSGSNGVGGLVGHNYGEIKDSYVNGTTNVTGTMNVGGLIGLNMESGNSENSHFNVDTVTLNDRHELTFGGLYGDQFNDWLSHGKKLNIADYATSLSFDGSVYTINELQGMKDLLGFADAGYSFKLANGFSLDSGFSIPYFVGNFDGAGYTLSGLDLALPNSSVGLFGMALYGSTLQNIGVTGSVTGTTSVGGLVGYLAASSITNSHAAVDVTATGGTAGGLVGGSNGGTISDSYATGIVHGFNDAGGLVGGSGWGTVTRSYATGDVTSDVAYAGGLIGSSYNVQISESYATGNVSGADAGGLIGGSNGGTIINVYATGNVAASNGHAGGLVGASWDTSIDNAYALGAVSITGSGLAGGLVGFNNGGLIKNSLWNSDQVANGIGMYINLNPVNISGGTLAQLKTQAFFTDNSPTWDFNTVWDIQPDATPTFAVTNLWIGGASAHDWLNAANWSRGLPNAGQKLVIPDVSSWVELSSPSQALTYRSLVANQEFRLSGANTWLTLNGGGSFSNLKMGAGTRLTVNGALSMNSDYSLGAGAKIDLGDETALLIGGESYTQIRDVHQLSAIRNDLYGRYAVIADFDASSVPNFMPIGMVDNYSSNYFTGIFDGLGHSISNLTINYPDAYRVALFSGTDSSATVRNIGLTNVSVTGNSDYTAGLVGSNDGAISNSYVTGTVSGSSNVGGLVGYSNGTISNSYASVTVSGSSNVGGLVGSNNGTVSNSYASATVSGSSNVGGLVGYNEARVRDSYVADGSQISGQDGVGGLIGHNDIWGGRVAVSNSHYNIDAVDINGGHFVTTGGVYGGQFADWLSNGLALDIAQYLGAANGNGAYSISSAQGFKDLLGFADGRYQFVLSGNVDLSPAGGLYIPYFNGNLDGAGHTVSGLNLDGVNNLANNYYLGLFGYVTADATLSNLTVGGQVSGSSYVGGLVGYNNGSISNSHSTVAVTGNSGVGGLVGQNLGMISGSSASGLVQGSGSYGAWGLGGLVGANYGSISASHASGNVQGGLDSNAVGGLVGYNSESISDSYVASGVAVSGSTDVGGLVGYGASSSSISNSHYNIDTVNLNGVHAVSIGGVYGGQFTDWLNNGLSLNIAQYLGAPDGNSVYSIGNLQGMKDLLGFADAGFNFKLTANVDLGTAAGFYIPWFVGNFDGQGHRLTKLNVGAAWRNSQIGLFGVLQGELSNVGVSGQVSGGSGVGGLVGMLLAGSSLSNSDAAVTVSGINQVGGLVGYAYSATISGSHATGAVSGLSETTGGLVGFSSHSQISNAYASGNVSGASMAGGLVGHSDNDSFQRVYATGDVTANSYVGGLIGWMWDSNLDQAYASGRVTGNGEVGGLIGYNYDARGTANITRSFWNSEANPILSGIGYNNNSSQAELPTGLINMDAMDSDSYAGFDFSSGGDWWLKSGNTRPMLRSEWSTTVSNAHQLQLMALDLSASYTLSQNIDLAPALSQTGSVWGSQGFVPLGNAVSPFTGQLAGGGHAVSNLLINRPGENSVGLFGVLGAGAQVSELALTGVEIIGGNQVGSLVGLNAGMLHDVYASGWVSGNADVGGLVGSNGGSIANSYARVLLDGGSGVGGLVGSGGGSVTSSFWDRTYSGITQSAGGIGLDTTQMLTASNFAGWSGSIWGFIDGIAYPYLKGQFNGTPQIVSGTLGGLSPGGQTVQLVSGGRLLDKDRAGANGFYYVALEGISVADGKALLAYLPEADIDLNEMAGSVRLANGGHMTGLNLVPQTLNFSSSSASPVTAAALAEMLGSLSDETIPFTISNNILTTTATHLTQNAALSVVGLEVLGNGDVLLENANNVIGQLAVSGAGSVKVVSSAALSLDLVGLTKGIMADDVWLRANGLRLEASASVTAGATSGNSIVLDAGAGDFVNASGSSSPLSVQSGARFLVYTADSATAVLGGMADKPIYGMSYAVNGPESTEIGLRAGNRLVYADAGTAYTLVVDDKTRIYGDANPLLTYQPLAAMSGDVISNVTLSTGAMPDSNVGSYVIDKATAYSDYNLQFNVTTGLLTVDKANLTATTNAASKTYDGLIYSGGNGVTYSGFVNNETESVLGGNLIYGGTAQSAKNAGNYTLTATGLVSGNYNIAYVDSALTIDKAHLTVTADDKARLFGYANPTLTTTISGFVNGETASTAGLTGSGSAVTTATGTTYVGTAAITAGFGTLAAANYDFTTLHDGSLTISADPANFRWAANQAGAWELGTNWNQGVAPVVGSQVTIPSLPGVLTYSVGSTMLQSLNSGASLSVTGGILNLGQASSDVSTFASGKNIIVAGGTLGIKGRLDADQVSVQSGTLNLSDAVLSVLNPLNNAGTLNVLSGHFAINSGVTNTGAFNVAAGASLDLNSFAYSGSGSLSNAGQLTASAQTLNGFFTNTGTTDFTNVVLFSGFRNQGVVNVYGDLQAGDIRPEVKDVATGVSIFTPLSTNAYQSGGSINLVNGATLTKGKGVLFWEGGVFGGDGRLIFSSNGGTFAFAGNGDRVINNPNLAFNFTDLTLPDGSLTVRNGTLGLAGTTTIPQLVTLNLSGGTLDNTGQLNIGGTFNLTGGTFIGGGAIAMLGGAMNRPAGSTVNWQSTGNLANTGTLNLDGGTITNAIDNQGKIVLGAGTTFTQTFTNTGELDVGSGTTVFQGGYNQSSGLLKLAGGDVQGSVNINGGSLGGSGTINGDVIIGTGSFAPGFSPGAMTVNGNLTLLPSSVLTIELGGLAQGSGYDFINVLGTATLAGTLNVNAWGGYVAAPGTNYTFMNFSNRSGAFATVNLPTGWNISLASNLNSLQLNIANLIPPAVVTPLVSQLAITPLEALMQFMQQSGGSYYEPMRLTSNGVEIGFDKVIPNDMDTSLAQLINAATRVEMDAKELDGLKQCN